jgi:chitin disaccharide deacetylase
VAFPKRDVIINADDYAMDGEVDTAILGLAERGIVTATSAMVLSPRWSEAAPALRDAPLSSGLHLDFTSPFPKRSLPTHSLSRLILLSHAGLIDRSLFRREIQLQLASYEASMGKAPGFIDGHQHVHHLPGVREILLEALSDHYGADARNIGVRICVSRHWRGLKSAIIAGTGASGLARDAAAKGHFLNTDFAGVYDFAPNAALQPLWRSWFQRLDGSAPLIMCHVAKISATGHTNDQIRQARYREYHWLSSEGFLELRQHFAINPVRWPRTSQALH